MRGLGEMQLPGRWRLQMRVPVAWDLGLGRELGNVFWAMIGVEGAFGAYVGIWPLWIEALGAPITVVGFVLGSSGLLRLLTLAPSAALADRIDPRTLILVSGALIARFDMRAAFIFAAVCTAFSIYFFSRFAPRPKVAKEDEPTRSSYREALAEPGVKPLLGMQFATIFSLALGISLLPTFLADQRGVSPAIVAMLGGIGSLGAVVFGLAVARSQWLQRRPLTGIAIAIGMVMGALAVVVSTNLVWLIALAFVG